MDFGKFRTLNAIELKRPGKSCIWIAPLLFLLIYSIEFFFLPINMVHLLVGVICATYFLYGLTRFELQLPQWKRLKPISVFLGFLLIYNTTSLIFKGTSDLLLIKNLAVIVAIIFCSSIIGEFFSKKGFEIKDFVFLVAFLTSLQGIFIVLNYVSPIVKSFFDSILPVGGNFVESPLFRSRGFSNVPGANLSVIQAIGMLFCSFCFFYSKSWLSSLSCILGAGLCFISIVLSGRTGFFILPLIFLFGAMSFKLNVSSFFSSKILLASLVVCFFLFATIAFLDFGGSLVGEELLEITLSRAVAPFVNNSELKGPSIWEVFFNFIVFPESDNILIFGDLAEYTNSNSFTDMGYIRNLFGLGLIGCLLYYSFYLFCFVALVARLKKKEEQILFFILGVWFFFIEFKEPFLRNAGLNFLLFIPFFMNYKFSKSKFCFARGVK